MSLLVGQELAWTRLGEYVRSARIRRGFRTQPAFAAKTGLSVRTIGDLERGSRINYESDTLAVVEYALGWAPGSVASVLAGGQPIDAGPGDEFFATVLEHWPHLGTARRRVVSRVTEELRYLNLDD